MAQEVAVVINLHNTLNLCLVQRSKIFSFFLYKTFLYREQFSEGCQLELKKQQMKIDYKSKEYLKLFFSKDTKTEKKWNILGRLLTIETISYKNNFFS